MAMTHLKGTGAPAPVLEPADLMPWEVPCRYCRAPRIVLKPKPGAVPSEGNIDLSHLHDLIGGLREHIYPEADRRGCDACEVRIAAERATGTPYQGAPIVDPTQALLAQLQQHAEVIYKTPKPKPQVPPVIATKAALQALARVNIPGFDPSVSGSEQWGMPFAQKLIDRAATGDFGQLGELADGDPDAGAKFGPLATQLDRNAAALKLGRGVVRGAYPIQHRGTTQRSEWDDVARRFVYETVPGDVTFREVIQLDVIVGPDGLVFVHLGHE